MRIERAKEIFSNLHKTHLNKKNRYVYTNEFVNTMEKFLYELYNEDKTLPYSRFKSNACFILKKAGVRNSRDMNFNTSSLNMFINNKKIFNLAYKIKSKKYNKRRAVIEKEPEYKSADSKIDPNDYVVVNNKIIKKPNINLKEKILKYVLTHEIDNELKEIFLNII